MTKIKPVNHDMYLEYRCPECQASHWLTLKESQTKGFKVVCICDHVFQVKRIEDIKILYVSKKQQDNSKDTIINNTLDIYHKCIKVLEQYSFSEEEMRDIVKETVSMNQQASLVDMVKLCIAKFGEKNNAECN